MVFDIAKLDTFPTQPGVYLMKDGEGKLLYVGKAKNLRQRIKQYFAVGRDGRMMVPFLIAKIEQIETVVVRSEKEALLLENSLIKQHQPRYNAVLKDDKTYISLMINHKHPWPRLQLVRHKGKPKEDALFFGPYTQAGAARATFELLHRLFPLRQCSDQELIRRTRPCILYEMKRCMAPCVQKCTSEEYLHALNQAIRFLKGQDEEILKELKEEMTRAAEKWEFERAGELLKLIKQLEGTIEKQYVEALGGIDLDAWSIFRQGEEVILTQLIFKRGRLTGFRHRHFSNLVQEDQEIFLSSLLQQYEQMDEIPHEILLPISLEEAETLSEILSNGKKRKVEILAPQKGAKKSLLEMAYRNAEAEFKKKTDKKQMAQAILLEMEEKLRLTRYPRRIECFDHSNIAGSDPVSSLVVFSDGEKDRDRYRKYKIRHSGSVPDDYAALQEVLVRRYKRAKEEDDLPDLIMIDGGKGHLNLTLKVLRELDIASVDLIGFAKEEGRHDKGMSADQVFLLNQKDPLILSPHSKVLFLLQSIRDEAHRFAIGFHRKLREKKITKSLLENIPGIGIIKRTALLRHFGSLNQVAQASEEQLRQVKGITKKDVEALLCFFHPHQEGS